MKADFWSQWSFTPTRSLFNPFLPSALCPELCAFLNVAFIAPDEVNHSKRGYYSGANSLIDYFSTMLKPLRGARLPFTLALLTLSPPTGNFLPTPSLRSRKGNAELSEAWSEYMEPAWLFWIVKLHNSQLSKFHFLSLLPRDLRLKIPRSGLFPPFWRLFISLGYLSLVIGIISRGTATGNNKKDYQYRYKQRDFLNWY